MRILIYSYNYHPEPIGIAPLMTELAEGLAARGHDVRVVTAMPNYPERKIYPDYRGKLYVNEERNGVQIQRCYVAIRPNPGLVTRIMLDGSFVLLSFFQALRGWRPDLILSPSPSLLASIPVALIKSIYNCPVVLNLQDIIPEAAVHTGILTNKVASRGNEILEKFAYASATHFSVIADGFTRNLLSKGVPNDKITCIPNWVDINFIRPLPKYENAFRQENQLGDKFVVMYSGNIARTQGISTIIRAAVYLKDRPDIVFVIVGEQNQLAELDLLRQELGASNVILRPFAPREKLPEMLAAADMGLIMQKKNVVGFNMPSKTQVLLASGRPIVAAVPSNGTAAEAVRKSGGGLVTLPEDPSELSKAILSLYHDPQRLEALGRQGRHHAETTYSFNQAIESYEALFAALTSSQQKTVSALAPKAVDSQGG